MSKDGVEQTSNVEAESIPLPSFTHFLTQPAPLRSMTSFHSTSMISSLPITSSIASTSSTTSVMPPPLPLEKKNLFISKLSGNDLSATIDKLKEQANDLELHKKTMRFKKGSHSEKQKVHKKLWSIRQNIEKLENKYAEENGLTKQEALIPALASPSQEPLLNNETIARLIASRQKLLDLSQQFCDTNDKLLDKIGELTEENKRLKRANKELLSLKEPLLYLRNAQQEEASEKERSLEGSDASAKKRKTM